MQGLCKPLLLCVCCVLVVCLVIMMMKQNNYNPSTRMDHLPFEQVKVKQDPRSGQSLSVNKSALDVVQSFKVKTYKPKDLVTKTDVSDQLLKQKINMSSCHELFPHLSEVPAPLNTVCIFTGRWHFLRVLIPHIYRELRVNGGPIDRVWFMAMGCTDEDLKKLIAFATAANEILNEDVFVFHVYTTEKITGKHGRPFALAYCEMHANLLQYPNNHYFKIDDDVVYIHPGSFTKVIENKEKFPKCLLHLFNIAGGNWMCMRIIQDKGVFKEVDNPGHINFHRVGGEGHSDSTTFALNAFLHYQKKNEVEKLFFDSRPDKKRFTMNAAMFDAGTFYPEILEKAETMRYTKDEPWWTSQYPTLGDRTNCIVGDALAVHFSHAPPSRNLVKQGMLKKFEDVVISLKESMKMDDELWELLEYKF